MLYVMLGLQIRIFQKYHLILQKYHLMFPKHHQIHQIRRQVGHHNYLSYFKF